MKINSIPEKTWIALQGRAKADPNYPQRKSVLEEQCVECCLKGPQQGNDRSLLLQKFLLPRTSSKCFVISTILMQISWTPGCQCAVQFPSTEQDSLHCVECPLPCAVRQDLSSAPSRGEYLQRKFFPGQRLGNQHSWGPLYGCGFGL